MNQILAQLSELPAHESQVRSRKCNCVHGDLKSSIKFNFSERVQIKNYLLEKSTNLSGRQKF